MAEDKKISDRSAHQEKRTVTTFVDLPHGSVTHQEEAERLAPHFTVLRKHHFPVNEWTVEEVHNVWLDCDSFGKLLKVFTSVNNQEIRSQMVQLGAKNNFFPVASACKLSEFVKFLKWLKSEAGSDAMRGIMETEQLKKQAMRDEAVDDIGYSLPTEQQADYREKVKRIREKTDREISKLRKEIQDREDKMKKELAEIKEKFIPASLYKGLDIDEINALCYEMYKHNAIAKDKPFFARGREGYKMARKMFEKEVRQRHMVDYCRNEDVRKKLLEFCNQMVLQSQEKGQHRQAAKFRFLLKAAGGRGAFQVPIKSEEEFDEDETRREDNETDSDTESSEPEDGVPANETTGAPSNRRKCRKEDIRGVQ